jgi:hypothetical protein
MMSPTTRLNRRMRALPAPELVSLVEGSEGRSEGDWWTQYGGALDPASGVIAFPPRSLPPCRVPNCRRCETRGTA